MATKKALSLSPASCPKALKDAHEKLAAKTKTALAQATAGAEQAAQEPPVPIKSTSHLRELTAAASRVFGWNDTTPQVTHNQLVITADQLRQIRMLRESTDDPLESPKEVEEKIKSLNTPEGQEELRRTASEWLGREQNVEQPQLPPPPPEPPDTYEITIRGDGGGVRVKP